MTQSKPRRRILCIRPRPNPSAGEILTTTSDEWVEALKLHCDVHEVQQDFDLDEYCGRIQPDLLILDAVNWTRPWPLNIKNPRAHATIPRVLYLNSDPHDPLRTLTMRMAAELGIQTVFATAEAYIRHMPELKWMNCFLIPQFIDTGLYKDHGLERSIPMIVFSAHLVNQFYSWRAETLVALEGRLPVLIYPHPGYHKDLINPFSVQGEDYALQLNRSLFAVADTTRCDYLVRKHLEIPACGSVLVAPESPALAHYGFVDLENCILGEGPNLVRKILDVAGDPGQYERIRAAGIALVHSRYAQRSWTFFLDWLDCHEARRPGQTIRQENVYGRLTIGEDGASGLSTDALRSRSNQMVEALHEGRSAILTGRDLALAEHRLIQVAGWLQHVAEPYFLLGIMALMRGDATAAALAIARRAEAQVTIDARLRLFDPVEAACLMLIARLIDNVALEQAVRDQASDMDHVCLRRTYWLLDDNHAEPDDMLYERNEGDLLSVQWLGDEDFSTWADLVGRILLTNAAKNISFLKTERLFRRSA